MLNAKLIVFYSLNQKEAFGIIDKIEEESRLYQRESFEVLEEDGFDMNNFN